MSALGVVGGWEFLLTSVNGVCLLAALLLCAGAAVAEPVR